MFCSKCGSNELAVCLVGQMGTEVPIRTSYGELKALSNEDIRVNVEDDLRGGASLFAVQIDELICRDCFTTFTVPKWAWSAWLDNTVDTA